MRNTLCVQCLFWMGSPDSNHSIPLWSFHHFTSQFAVLRCNCMFECLEGLYALNTEDKTLHCMLKLLQMFYNFEILCLYYDVFIQCSSSLQHCRKLKKLHFSAYGNKGIEVGHFMGLSRLSLLVSSTTRTSGSDCIMKICTRIVIQYTVKPLLKDTPEYRMRSESPPCKGHFKATKLDIPNCGWENPFGFPFPTTVGHIAVQNPYCIGHSCCATTYSTSEEWTTSLQ